VLWPKLTTVWAVELIVSAELHAVPTAAVQVVICSESPVGGLFAEGAPPLPLLKSPAADIATWMVPVPVDAVRTWYLKFVVAV
jgi:hypothetical protein